MIKAGIHIHFNLAHFDKRLCGYFDDPVNALIFRVELLRELNVPVSYMYVNNVIDNRHDITPMILGMQDYKLRHIISFPKQMVTNKPYIVFHTKIRLSPDIKNRMPIVKSNIRYTLDKFKSSHQIVIMGERTFERKLENSATAKSENEFIHSAYEDVLHLKSHNDVIDLTTESIHDHVDWPELKANIGIIQDAECNFTFGWGGSFCLALAFGQKCMTYIDNLNYRTLFTDAKLHRNNTFMFKDIHAFKTELYRLYGEK